MKENKTRKKRAFDTHAQVNAKLINFSLPSLEFHMPFHEKC